MLTRSRGMGASAVLGLAVLASYGALAAVALSAVGGGSVLSFPGWAVDAIIQVNAAPPPPTAQYGSVTATPTGSPTGGQAIVVTPPPPAAGTSVAVSTGKQGGAGASTGWLGECGGRRFGRRPWRRLKRRPGRTGAAACAAPHLRAARLASPPPLHRSRSARAATSRSRRGGLRPSSRVAPSASARALAAVAPSSPRVASPASARALAAVAPSSPRVASPASARALAAVAPSSPRLASPATARTPPRRRPVPRGRIAPSRRAPPPGWRGRQRLELRRLAQIASTRSTYHTIQAPSVFSACTTRAPGGNGTSQNSRESPRTPAISSRLTIMNGITMRERRRRPCPRT